jgi:hypothetical protein
MLEHRSASILIWTFEATQQVSLAAVASNIAAEGFEIQPSIAVNRAG